jgi:hypothetical protein
MYLPLWFDKLTMSDFVMPYRYGIATYWYLILTGVIMV